MSSTDSPSGAILVAEDHDDSRDAIRTLLEATGYSVEVAINGREAVERAIARKPDLVVMDVMMPEMDGLEATRVLRSHPALRQVPIIALTALEGGREHALAAGCDDFIAKPLNVRAFLSKVDGWIHNRASTGAESA